jgi:hypothetical protein
MAPAFLQVNGVEFELDSPMEQGDVDTKVNQIASATSEQRVTIKQGRETVTLVIKPELVWGVAGYVKKPGRLVIG